MTRNRALAAVALLTLLGFALRIYALDRVPFRGDEAFTVLNWITPPLADTLASDVPTRDPQPPLAYAVFWGWGQLTGTSELAVRLLPALVGTLGIPLLYALGTRLHSRYLGTLAALLWAAHPYLVWHAQDARNYALWATLSAAALWLALRALARQRRRDWALYVLAAVAAAYLYYLELFVLVALNLFVLAAHWRKWGLLRRWFAAQSLIALLLAPWFLQERLLTGSGYTGTTFSAEFARLFDWFLPTLTFGETLPPPLASFAWPLIGLALTLGLVAWWRQCRRCALLLLLLGAVPPLLLTLVSLRLNVFTPRYVLASAPAYTLVFAGLVVFGSRRAPTRTAQRALTAGLLAGLVTISAASLLTYYFDYAKAPDWRTLAAYLHARVDPADTLVIQAAADEAFTYYFANWSDHQRLPANPNQSAAEIASILEADERQYANIWLVANPSPGWPNAHVGAEWLANNMQLIQADSVAGLSARRYSPWQVAASELPPGSGAQFGSVAQLLGVRVLDQPTAADELVLLAYWQPLASAPTDLKVFVHLVPAAAPTAAPAAQDDQLPQDGRISARGWSGSGRFRDIYTLALKPLPAGTYSLFIGLYDPETGARVPLADGSDSYHIGDLTLPQP